MSENIDLSTLNIPEHVAIILDGNGRWAKNKHMPRTYGHTVGSKVVERTVEDASDIGIKYLTVYVFSTENWKRSQDEVSMLFSLIERYLRSLIKTGDIYGADFCYNQIPNRLDIFDVETYQKNPMDFYVVTTDVETGKPIYHLCPNGDATDIKWFRASASMPMVSNIVEIDGFKMLDGGISDSIPIHKFMEMGYEKTLKEYQNKIKSQS